MTLKLQMHKGPLAGTTIEVDVVGTGAGFGANDVLVKMPTGVAPLIMLVTRGIATVL